MTRREGLMLMGGAIGGWFLAAVGHAAAHQMVTTEVACLPEVDPPARLRPSHALTFIDGSSAR